LARKVDGHDNVTISKDYIASLATQVGHFKDSPDTADWLVESVQLVRGYWFWIFVIRYQPRAQAEKRPTLIQCLSRDHGLAMTDRRL
jgi:hypothetical protein